MTRKGFISLVLIPLLPKKKVTPNDATVAGIALVALENAAILAREKASQQILIGGKIHWNGSALVMALDRANGRKPYMRINRD